MKFLIDAQLPPGLVYWLNERECPAEHVDYCGLSGAKDAEIWNYALQTGSIIITKDEDFADRTMRSSECPVVVWFRIGNATNKALFTWLEPRWPSTIKLLNAGNRLIEVR